MMSKSSALTILCYQNPRLSTSCALEILRSQIPMPSKYFAAKILCDSNDNAKPSLSQPQLDLTAGLISPAVRSRRASPNVLSPPQPQFLLDLTAGSLAMFRTRCSISTRCRFHGYGCLFGSCRYLYHLGSGVVVPLVVTISAFVLVRTIAWSVYFVVLSGCFVTPRRAITRF